MLKLDENKLWLYKSILVVKLVSEMLDKETYKHHSSSAAVYEVCWSGSIITLTKEEIRAFGPLEYRKCAVYKVMTLILHQ